MLVLSFYGKSNAEVKYQVPQQSSLANSYTRHLFLHFNFSKSILNHSCFHMLFEHIPLQFETFFNYNYLYSLPLVANYTI